MANVTYDIMWREAMMEMLDLLEAESPEDPSLAPRDLAEWSCLYVKYLQTLKKLETAYDQIVHPQKRIDMKRALEACIGRTLEIKHWLVSLNKGLDCINLDDVLVDLKLTPEVLEVPLPRFCVEDRAQELEDRSKFLDTLVAKYSVPPLPEAGGLPEPAPLGKDEAVGVLQCNERGRQARERARIMKSVKRQRQLEDRRLKAGQAMTHEEAGRRIQACMRGLLTRLRVKREAAQELEFIGMKPRQHAPGSEPQAREAKTARRRKVVQAEHAREYGDAVVALKAKVMDLEGQDMRETIQDKINAWFVESRDPESGQYPDFPEEEDGGSRIILNPPPPPPPPPPVEDPKKKKAPPKKPDKPAKGKAEEPPKEEPKVGSAFVGDIEAALQEYVAKWQERDEAANFPQRHDAELVKDELRPLVFEEVRAAVDTEMRVLLANLKDMVEAERAARTGKKIKPKKAKKAKKGKKGKEGKGKKRKDPTAARSIESLFAELASNGIVQAVAPLSVGQYLGTLNYLGATLEKAAIRPDPSPSHVRQAVTEFCVLPLASKYIHQKAPLLKSVLLYGPPRTGKTLLAQAVASAAGAAFFNLSPRHTDGTYPAKQVALLLHMVFKVARVMAPAVVYIDEIEKVFVSDKKKSKEFGGTEPFSRIKKELLKEVKLLEPGDRVLVIGCSSEPYLPTKKDEKAFIGFFDKHIYTPLPDYASRMVLWPGLIERHGGRLQHDFDLSTLCHISEGYSSGTIDQVVRSMLTERRMARLREAPLQLAEVLQWLCRAQPASREDDEQLRAWTEKTPARAALAKAAKEAAEAKPDKDPKKGAKKK